MSDFSSKFLFLYNFLPGLFWSLFLSSGINYTLFMGIQKSCVNILIILCIKTNTLQITGYNGLAKITTTVYPCFLVFIHSFDIFLYNKLFGNIRSAEFFVLFVNKIIYALCVCKEGTHLL